MKWYKNLYVGKNAEKIKYKAFGRIKRGAFSPNLFLVIIANHKDNILDIVPSIQFKQSYFKSKRVNDRIYVVGIAKGYEEALSLVTQIVEDTYKNTGGFNVSGFLHFGKELS